MLTVRSSLMLIASGALAIVIWFGGPYIELDSYAPLASAGARVAFGLIVFAMLGLAPLLRAATAAGRKMKAVAGGWRERRRLAGEFETALGALGKKLPGGLALHDLPWYVVLGAPGSGKSTALSKSGLTFTFQENGARAARRGMGGTRNCDWWLCPDALFIETGGRFDAPPGDDADDGSGWAELLVRLRRYARRRPVRGIILTKSAQELVLQSEHTRTARVEATRGRLDDLHDALGVAVPVYVIVTKCDLLPGFVEYFEGLAADERTQVWGITFAVEETRTGQAASRFVPEFEALLERLRRRMIPAIDTVAGTSHRVSVFNFDAQIANLGNAVNRFIADVFTPARSRPRLLRGIYFTSGALEGTPVRQVSPGAGWPLPDAADGFRTAASPSSRARGGYFLSRVFDVVLAERGLVGVDWIFQLRTLAVHAMFTVIAVGAVLLFAVSFTVNRDYLNSVAADVARLGDAQPISPGADLPGALPRLDTLHTLAQSANRYREDIPLRMRWGLFQGDAIGNAARDAYAREINRVLLPFAEAMLRARLVENAARPEILFEYLKAYLMLGDESRVDREHLDTLLEQEWRTTYAATPETAAALSRHFRWLLLNMPGISPVALDFALVAQAQTSLRNASIPRIGYATIRSAYANDPRGVRLDEALGVAAGRILRRKSGRSLAEPVPALFTKTVFQEVTGNSIGELARYYASDAWVWGESRPSLAPERQLAAEVLAVYESDYIDFWDSLMEDLSVSFAAAETADALAIVASPASPIRAFFALVDQHTRPGPVPLPEPTGQPIQDRLNELLAKAKVAAGTPPEPPGARITAHFSGIHRMLAGNAGETPLDLVLAKVAQLRASLASAAKAGTEGDRRELVRSIGADAAALPPAVGALVADIAARASSFR